MIKEEIEIRCQLSDMHIEEREGAIESRVICGYAVTFDTWSNPICGWFKETITRNSFDECDMSDVVMNFNHNIDGILARTTSGTLSIVVDNVGVKFQFEAPATTLGNDMLVLIKRGDINKCSFAFTVEVDTWVYADVANNLTLDERTILKVKKLYDLALVVHPAYSATNASVRKLEERKTEFLKQNNVKTNSRSSIERQFQLMKLRTNN